MEDKREVFLRVYANIPEGLRGDIIVLIDGKPYTWNVAYLEVKENTALGRKVLKALGELGIL